MDLSILIVNWKSVRYLPACLSSIGAQRCALTYEILVIDNASFDGCEELLASDFPQVRFLQAGENLGFARANNEASRHASGKVLCFLNPDTIIRDNALGKLYDALTSTRDGGAVGALLRNADESVQTSCVMPYPRILNQALDLELLRKCFPRSRLFAMKPLFADAGEPQEVEAVSGACVMVPRTVFDAVGGFSEDYFMYAEDLDLCYKIRSSGKKIMIEKNAEIVHLGGGSSNNQSNRLFSTILMRESNYLFQKKFRGRGYALVARCVFLLAGLFRILGMILLFPFSAVAGRPSLLTKAMRRWWHEVLWAAGFERWPSGLHTGRPDGLVHDA